MSMSTPDLLAKADELRARGLTTAAERIVQGYGRATKMLSDLAEDAERTLQAPNTPAVLSEPCQVHPRLANGEGFMSKPRRARQVKSAGVFSHTQLSSSTGGSIAVAEGDWLVQVNRGLIKRYNDDDVNISSPKQQQDF